MAAAVADFRPADPAADKIKKEAGGVPEIRLEATDDVLRATRDARPSGCVVVGFALETADAVENGRRKLEGKGLDLLVVNDATEPGAGFEVDTNRVVLLAPGVPDEALPLMPKSEVADHILDRVEQVLAAGRGA
jgi:phosphopantothenoylcysteine decarboxylase/phosphopantothenate--cysteine ligase